MIKVNGNVIRDVVDFQFYVAEPSLDIEVDRDGELLELHAENETGEPLGIEFAAPTFNGIRQCANKCLFCFIDGLPANMRNTLYVKDDDYRHSFLFSNFLTLTNLGPADWRRLEEQRLSPLYVSVHTTNNDIRRRLLGNPKAPDIMGQLRRLASLKTEINVQIVLCPEINDGVVLQQTLEDLASLFPSVQSVAVVPVVLTKYNCGGKVRGFKKDEADRVIDEVSEMQPRFRQRLGKGFVYLADEFYLVANRTIPPSLEYDNYPLYQNGIGLTRTLLDEAVFLKKRLHKNLRGTLSAPTKTRKLTTPSSKRQFGVMEGNGESADNDTQGHTRETKSLTLACGKLIGPTLDKIAKDLFNGTGVQVEVIPVENHFFGENVTVSGLLTGQDVLGTLREHADPMSTIILPRAMLDSEGIRFLDDLKPSDISEALRREVRVAGSLQEVLSIAGQIPATRLRSERRLY